MLNIGLSPSLCAPSHAQMLGIHFEVDTVFAGPSPDFDLSGELEGYMLLGVR